MNRYKLIIIILTIGLTLSLGYIFYQKYQDYKTQLIQESYLQGYQAGYQQAVYDSVVKVISDIQANGYTSITFQNQTVPLCICRTE